jgi:hypothetical protein
MSNTAGVGGLAGRPTGPELCAELALLDPHSASNEQLMDQLTAQPRQLAYQQAQLWTVLAEIAVRDPNVAGDADWNAEQIFESGVDEIRAELLLTRRAAQTELANADGVARLPQVMQALADGVIDRKRAIVLAEGCLDLTEQQTTVLLTELLPEAGQVTATRLADKVRRAAIARDPAWARRRYTEAVRERKVVGYLNSDGSATVSGQNLPADQAAMACARVDALADTAKRAGAAAKIDHLRAELFLGLLDGRFHGLTEQAIITELLRLYPKQPRSAEQPAAESTAAPDETAEAASVRPVANPTTQPASPTTALHEPAGSARLRGVHVRVRLATLLGLNDQPGEIAGWGDIPAPVARDTVTRQHRSEWRYAIVDDDGQLLFDGITRRRPRTGGPAAGQVAGQNEPVRGGIVELHVPIALLDDPALAARHPEWAGVLADLAAQYAEQRPIEQDPTARFAGRPLRRRTQILFQRCIFRGCRRPATDCDLDHRHEHSRGGRTEDHNLGPGCKHDHLLKTSGGWRLVRRDEKTFVWISPLARKHVVTVEPIAPPLPTPIPRDEATDLRTAEHDGPDPPPTYEPRDRRGRPLAWGASAAGLIEARAVDSAVDPPPF